MIEAIMILTVEQSERRFLMLVQTMLLSRQIQGNFNSGRVVAAFTEALFIPSSALSHEPLQLIRMAEEFVKWHVGDHYGNSEGLQPAWYLDEWVSKDY